MIRPTSLILSVLVLGACSAQAPRRDTHERLNGLLWVQTSAEYRALAAVTYRDAFAKVEALSRQARKGLDVASAALEQPGRNTKGLPLAVIVDIDETVLDNSRMTGKLIHDRKGWDENTWSDWVNLREATFIEGAKEFIEKTRAAGVKVFFVTNRKAAEQQCTIDNLKPLVVTEDEVLASGEIDPDEGRAWLGEKQKRRAYLARSNWILAMVGDDLADFLPCVRKATPDERVAAMREHLSRFGDRWFLLPNPVYGSWESVLYGQGVSDEKQLSDKIGKVRGFQPAPPATGCLPLPGASPAAAIPAPVDPHECQ